ncbi:hypothetical protein J27TS7_03640 [Paenibacillus dendritiformis]|nr:hypothetical protein J27TS7_03640 [Paenibacillus dendritiformis]
MKAHASLGWTDCIVMLGAEAGEHLNTAVIHAHRYTNRQHAKRLLHQVHHILSITQTLQSLFNYELSGSKQGVVIISGHHYSPHRFIVDILIEPGCLDIAVSNESKLEYTD